MNTINGFDQNPVGREKEWMEDYGFVQIGFIVFSWNDFAFSYCAFADFNFRRLVIEGRGGFCQSWRARSAVMMAELETTGRRVDVHYVNAGEPCTVEENFEGYYLEHGDLSFEELLQDQEILFQSFQTNAGNNAAEASTSSHTTADGQQGGVETTNIKEEGESSQPNQVASQLASDEALARTMQEMENQFAGTSISGTARRESETPPSSSTSNGEPSSTDTTMVARQESQDNIDPDNMTYEELQSFGESIGTESRGLSDELIAYLPSFKYKTGLFSKKDKHEGCVICYTAYKNRDVVMTLPCQHQYHSNCIAQWLKLNKACPVCKEEVFGS